MLPSERAFVASFAGYRHLMSYGTPPVGVATGFRALAVAAAVGFPPVAGGVIARRKHAMAALEKVQADRLAMKTISSLRREFGSGPVELRLPGRRLVVVLDDEDAAAILADTPERFTPANREKVGALRPFQPHGVLISTQSGRRQRRPLNEAALEAPAELHSCAESFASTIAHEVSDSASRSRGTGELDADSLIETWWRIVRQITLGEAARDDTELTDRLWSLRSNGNWSYFVPSRSRLRDRFFENLYSYAENPEPGSLLAALDAHTRGAAQDPIGQIPHWLFAFDAAGMATIRALALLATHPDQMNRARAEAADVGPTTPHPLPFARSCIMESLRLWPTTPAILRDSLIDTSWGPNENRIRAGSAFLVYTPAFHRDADRLDYADEFVPDVWLDGRADSQRGFLPFSSGPAECPGRNIALFTASTVLKNILVEFENIALTSTPKLSPDRPLPVTLNHYGLDFRVR